MSLQLTSTMRTAFLCESVTVECWKDYALYVVEVDSSSQGIQTLYRKRMQQHGTFGEMTKPTNCAKYLMIDQPTICSNIYISILPQFLQHGYTKREKAAAYQQEWEAAVSDTHDTSQALTQKDFSEKHTQVLTRTKFKVHTGSNIRLASPQ